MMSSTVAYFIVCMLGGGEEPLLVGYSLVSNFY
jgi:hypothetical protein